MMMNLNGPDLALPSSADPHQIFPAAAATQHLHRDPVNPKQKRSKVITIDDASSAVAVASGSRTIAKPKYSRKPDPGAPKITPPCSECGKTFWSWKALFGHMRCHPERQWRGINPPPNRLREPPSPPSPRFGAQSFPVFDLTMTGEDHEVASSLLLLANGRIAASEARSVGRFQEALIPEMEESPEERNPDGGGAGSISCGRFECSSCKKVFGSHQALGGHRASHKNVKGCFAITKSTESEIDQDPYQTGVDQATPRSSSVSHDGGAEHEKMVMLLGAHRCSICLRGFSSGQALGGHKRCHWDTKWEEQSVNHGFDLNLPAPAEDDYTVTSSESYCSGLTLDLRLGL